MEFPGDLLSGNISSLANCIKLKILNLGCERPYNTKTYGDLNTLANCSNIEIFGWLYHTNISGDISVIANWSNLNNFAFSSSSISGSIDTFANTSNTKIWLFHIAGTSISGNINSLSGYTALRRLAVNNLTNLEILYIADQLVNSGYQMTNLIYGDIKAFANCTGLKEISIGQSSNLTGDISVFANCPNLGMFRIILSPNLTGDISVFENCNIYHIAISGYSTIMPMKITGDISVFRSKNMINIYINFCQVYGNISSLNNLTRLRALEVNNLNIPNKPGIIRFQSK